MRQFIPEWLRKANFTDSFRLEEQGLQPVSGSYMIFTVGQEVTYLFYGVKETAKVIRQSGSIVWLDNGRWMNAESCRPVLEELK